MKLLDYQPGQLAKKLENYLSIDAKFQAVFDYTKQRFEAATELPAHNWEHTYRDILNAIVIGEAESADMNIVLSAITMHDIGFIYGSTGRTHGALGAEKLPEYLSDAGVEFPDDMVQKMADCIRTHKGSMHDEKPGSLEAKVVADADLMEKFGPFGVYQYIRSFTEFNRPLSQIVLQSEEIKKLKLETETGKKLAEPGRQFVADFFNELIEAAKPYQDD